MRTIMKRIGNDITNPSLNRYKDKPLNHEQAAQKISETMRALRATEPANFIPKKMQSTTSDASGNGIFPISDVTGSRGLVSLQRNKDGDNSEGKSDTRAKDPYIPISVVTGSRDITTVSPELRAFLLKGSPSATTAMPEEYADLSNVLDKAGDVINFENWADLTAKQQLTLAQKAGLSLADQQELLNASPHYVETIAKVKDVFANRYELGITLADARNTAKELFDIANEREEAYTRTGKYEQDAVFAPRALRWLDEEEKKLLDNLPKKASEPGKPTWYNGESSEPEENKETAADIHRRAKYADIDVDDATKQIESQIMKNIEEAKKLAALSYIYGNAPSAYHKQAEWFLDQVSQNKPMDYKNPAIWYKTFPDLPYPKEDQVYDVFGYKVSSSDLGNLNYALVGKTLGLPEWLLLQQAGAAQLQDHEDYGKFKSQIESIKLRHEGYGDQLDDQEMIENGFSAYNLLD